MSNLVAYGRQEAASAAKSARAELLRWFDSILREELEKARGKEAQNALSRIEEKVQEAAESMRVDPLDFG